MNQYEAWDEKTWKRIKLLIISRVIVLSVLLLITFFLGTVWEALPISPLMLKFIYVYIVVMYVLSFVYTLLLRKEKYFQVNIYTQFVADIFLISFLVYLTGSISGNYSLIYTLVIIYSAIFLGRRGALIIATICTAAYGVLILFEYFEGKNLFYQANADYAIDPRDLLVRMVVYAVSFYVVALLASFVVEQERKARTLLEERESAFNQLDLLFRSIIESVDTGIMTTTLQGRIKTFNRAAEAITGRQALAIENRQVLDVFPEFQAFFDVESLQAVKSRLEVKISGKQGMQVHLGCSISPLKDRNENQIGHILIFQDLTEIKQMEEKLEQSKRLALIGEMAAGLAHEMRNPLASITGSIQLLARTARMEETDQRLMQIIVRGKDQLDNFVRDFLLLARPVPENREVVCLSDLAQDVLENLKISGQCAEYIHINKSIARNVNTLANKEQIRQVLQNLLLNALQAMEKPGNLFLEICTAKQEDDTDYAKIVVTDEGCGIEEKDLKKVFEPFFTKKEKGTGLGLAIVNRIIDGYGGKIDIESRIHCGTTVTVWLPCFKNVNA